MASALHPSNPYYSSQWTESPSHAQSGPQLQRSRTELPPSAPAQSPTERPRNAVTYRTRSIGRPFTAVIFERYIEPVDDEIIICTVRVTNSFRRASVEGCEDLPSRPPPRSFLRRMSTRLSGSPDANRYTAIKMPRRDYKKFFVRDRDGNYAGSEPEREWSQEDLDREFDVYQDMPLMSIPGGQEYGEGRKWSPGAEG